MSISIRLSFTICPPLALLVVAATCSAVEPIQQAAQRYISDQPAEPCADCGWRKGWPQKVACYARPSINHRYVGSYVGGGAALFGRPRMRHEGTWGVDYVGTAAKHLVWLDWWDFPLRQGGRGAYKTDGPRILETLKHER